jgi:hypothetical protein
VKYRNQLHWDADKQNKETFLKASLSLRAWRRHFASFVAMLVAAAAGWLVRSDQAKQFGEVIFGDDWAKISGFASVMLVALAGVLLILTFILVWRQLAAQPLSTDAAARQFSGKIFLNYRRDDDPWFARLLFEHLEQCFPSRLFIDVEGIPPGDDFVRTLEEQVSTCDAMLVVIGPKWLAATDEVGRRRRFCSYRGRDGAAAQQAHNSSACAQHRYATR